MKIQVLVRELSVKRIVVWGLRTTYSDSYHFIQRGFYETLKKLGVNAIWVDDSLDSVGIINPDDLILAANRAMKFMPYIQGCRYCLHNADISNLIEVDPKNILFLQVLTKDRVNHSLKSGDNVNTLLEGSAYFEIADRMLYQSWGTPLLEKDFFKPNKLTFKKREFFVGTIWNNSLGQGNDQVIPIYQRALNENGIKFIHVQGAPEFLNPTFVRYSAVGASIVGDWQREWGYAPCRLFKAVSYGVPGLINSKALLDAHPWACANEDIVGLVNFALELSQKDFDDLVCYQQRFVAKETYESKVKNILNCLIYLAKSN